MLSRVGLEVYVTEKIEEEVEEETEENSSTDDIKNKTSKTGTIKKKTSKNEDNKNFDSEEGDEENEETSTSEITGKSDLGFTLENGPTIHIDYVGELFSDSFEMDYTDISSNSSVSVPLEYVELFFKGKKIALKKAWQKNTKLKWEEMETAVLGFCTELTWNREKVDVRISGMDKLMDVQAQFNFTQMKRSEIIKQIIETAGLKAEIDTTGLIDDITDFTNISSSGEDSGSGDSTGSATIDEAVEKAIKGKKGCLEKAKAIDNAFKSHIIYDYYYDCDYPNDLDKAWKDGTLNCADGANILCAMFNKAKISSSIIHTDGHYIVKVTCDGTDYYTDNAANSGNHTTRPFGEVWNGNTSGSDMGTHLDY